MWLNLIPLNFALSFKNVNNVNNFFCWDDKKKKKDCLDTSFLVTYHPDLPLGKLFSTILNPCKQFSQTLTEIVTHNLWLLVIANDPEWIYDIGQAVENPSWNFCRIYWENRTLELTISWSTWVDHILITSWGYSAWKWSLCIWSH